MQETKAVSEPEFRDKTQASFQDSFRYLFKRCKKSSFKMPNMGMKYRCTLQNEDGKSYACNAAYYLDKGETWRVSSFDHEHDQNFIKVSSNCVK